MQVLILVTQKTTKFDSFDLKLPPHLRCSMFILFSSLWLHYMKKFVDKNELCLTTFLDFKFNELSLDLRMTNFVQNLIALGLKL